MRRVPIVLNIASGGSHGQVTYNEVRRLFSLHGIEADILTAEDGKGLEAQVREALRTSPEVVVAAGGDGTVSTVAALLRGTGVALGVLPAGTLNHFARDLGIPTDLEGAVAAIAQGAPVDVDVGEVNGRTFVNNASLGLYPQIVRHRKRRQELYGHGKYWAMLGATLTVLGRNPFLRLKLQLDDRVERCRTPFVFIGNNDYVMEGFSIGTRSSLRDGKLSIYTTQRRTRGGLVRLAFRALLGRLSQAKDFAVNSASSVRIDSKRRYMLVATDGEVTAMETPLNFRVLPGALSVILPPKAA